MNKIHLKTILIIDLTLLLIGSLIFCHFLYKTLRSFDKAYDYIKVNFKINRKYISHIGSKDGLFFSSAIFDGGSDSILFQLVNGEECNLYLFKGYESNLKNPKRKYIVKNGRVQDGDFYWGHDNFNNGIPLDCNSELADEIIEVLCIDLSNTKMKNYTNKILIEFISKLYEKRKKS